MAGVATGHNGGISHPLDPSDLSGCFQLITEVPEVKQYFPEISKLSTTWKLMIEHWDKLEKSLTEEVGIDWSKGNTAPKTLKLIRNIIKEASLMDLKNS